MNTVGAATTPRTRSLVALGLTVIYATCFVAIKAGLAFAPLLFFGGLRALIAGLAWLGLVIALGRPVLPARRAWGWIMGLALTATTLTFSAMFLSPGLTGAGIASVLGNSQPIIAVVLAAMFLGERLTRGKGVALACGTVGIMLISSAALAGPDAYGFSGAMLALLASTGSAIGSVIVKRMGHQPSLLAVTAWQLIIGSLPLLGIAALVERDATVVWNLEFVGLLLFLALVGTSLTFALWYWLIQYEEVGRLTIVLFMVPVLGLAFAVLSFGEQIQALQAIGVLATLAGIGAVVWESWHGEPTPDAAGCTLQGSPGRDGSV